MEYFAIYTKYDEDTLAKSHMAFQADENAVSIKLEGNPYKAFEEMPEYIDI